MAHEGAEFGVDLYELERVARNDFPAVAADYGESIAACARVRDELEQVMRRPEQFGGDSLGPVFRTYRELHDTLVGLLSETRANLEATGAALDRAARHYAETDGAARDELHRRARADPNMGDL